MNKKILPKQDFKTFKAKINLGEKFQLK